MRTLLRVLLHPSSGMAGVLVWNYTRHRRGLSTICSTTRTTVPPALFCAAWAALTVWLVPHYCNPFRRLKGD